MDGPISQMRKVRLKETRDVLAGWLRWLECRPVHEKFTGGSIPGRGTCGRQPIDVSHFNVFLLLKSINISSGDD